MTCLAGPSLGLATLEAALVVEAVAEGDGGLRSGQVQIPFLPAPAPESPTLTLTNQQPSASLLLRGHPDVLAAMTVSFSLHFLLIFIYFFSKGGSSRPINNNNNKKGLPE